MKLHCCDTCAIKVGCQVRVGYGGNSDKCVFWHPTDEVKEVMEKANKEYERIINEA